MFDTLMNLINACGYDVDFLYDHGVMHLTIEDFEGFDDDWGEVMRDYDNPDAVDALLDWLNVNSNFKVEEFYTIYSFDGFSVELGYTSFDI